MEISFRNKKLELVIPGLLILLMAFNANATVVNGNFDDRDEKWDDDSRAGSFLVIDGRGVLQTKEGSALPFSAVAIQGDDGSFSFPEPIEIDLDVSKLLVDLSFERSGPDAGEDSSASSFTDSFSITFLDKLDPTFDSLIISTGDSFIPTAEFLTYMFDVSGIAGRSGALAFELHDENDGFDTQVVFDNVSFVSQVPVPAAVWLFGSALLGLVGSNLSRKSVHL